MTKPDLDNKARIKEFIEAFYAKMLRDEMLGYIFLDVAGIDINKHLPIIRGYWEKLLLGEDNYKRHTMNIHRALHSKKPLRPDEFIRWLTLFFETVDENFAGPKAERAKEIALHIATNMNRTVGNEELDITRFRQSSVSS